MEWFLKIIALWLAVIIMIPLYRTFRGPTVFDRIVGASVVGTKSILLILLVGLTFNRFEMFVDIALAYGILNFIGALVIAQYFARDKQGLAAETHSKDL